MEPYDRGRDVRSAARLYFLAVRERSIWQFVLLWCFAASWAWRLLPAIGFGLPTLLPAFLPGVIAYLGYSKFRPRLTRLLLPIYLFLLLILSLASFGIKIAFHLLASRPFAIRILAELLLIAIAAVAGYHPIEEPLIRLGVRFAQFEDPVGKTAQFPAGARATTLTRLIVKSIGAIASKPTNA